MAEETKISPRIQQSLRDNEPVFRNMSLEQRLEMRKLLQDGLDMHPFMKRLAKRFGTIDEEHDGESRLLIRLLDRISHEKGISHRAAVRDRRREAFNASQRESK